MIRKRITKYGLAAFLILCVLWLFAGCADNTESQHHEDQNDQNDQDDQDDDCSAARLSGLIDEALALATVDVDTAYDEHLLSDPWTGERADCESPAPDPIWREGPWIKTREPCVHHSCVLFDETNFSSGFGALKDGTMTLETIRLQSVSETPDGWDVIITCGWNGDDNSTSLFIPLRVYSDLDTGCLDGIKVAVPGYIEIDYFSIWIVVVDGIVSVNGVYTDDVDVYFELSGIQAIDGLHSDTLSWLASWMERDIEGFFGPMAKESVEAAYDEFVAECP